MKKLLLPILLINTYALLSQSLCNIHNFGNIQVHTDGKVGFHSNVINDGNFDQNTGEVGFYNKNEGLTISGNNSPVFFDMITDVAGELNLEVSTGVTNSKDFRNGRIVTPRNTPAVALDFINDSPYFGENNNKHVDGYVTNTGLLDFTFPVGDDFRLRPMSIEVSASQTTSRGAYFFENPEDNSTFSDSFDLTKFEPTLSAISPVEFWDLDGETATRVTLTWDAQSAIANLADTPEYLRVVGWNPFEEKWIDLGNEAFTGDLTSGTMTSEAIIPNEYTVLTIGSILKASSDIFVYTGISPNGDLKNDFLVIEGIETSPNNELTIFNRWGVVVYKKENYRNTPEEGWTGVSNGRATLKKEDLLPVGTYFYVLKLKDREDKTGYIYLQR